MAKLNTYRVIDNLPEGVQFVGLIPSETTEFETVRASRNAIRQFILDVVPTIKGDDGKPVELRTNATAIQWRYVGDAAWVDLVLLSSLKGDKGNDGKRVILQKSPTHIQWGYFGDDTWTNLVALIDLQGPPGQAGAGLKNRDLWVTGTTYQPGDYVFAPGTATDSSMWILRGTVEYTSVLAPKDDLDHWVEFVAPAGKDGDPGDNGTDGRSVELQKTTDAIQWRWMSGSDLDWKHLVLLTEIKGNPGDPGAAGSKWFTGTTVPAAGTGANGDFYLRSNGDFYGPKAAGAWGAVVGSLKGLTGNTGPGVPNGGALGQVLVKLSATDLDVGWATPSSGGGGGAGDVTKAGDQTFTGFNIFQGKVYHGIKPTTGAVLPPADPAGTSLFSWDNAYFWKRVTLKDGMQVDGTPSSFTSNLILGAGYSCPNISPMAISGSTVSPTPYVPQQSVPITANTAALTLQLPAASSKASGPIVKTITNGMIFRFYFPFDVTALTVLPGGGVFEPEWTTSKVIGNPTTFKAGVMEVQFVESQDAWYFLHG